MNVKRSDSKFIAVSRQPMRFWLKEREKELDCYTPESAETPEENKSQKRSFSERDLHPLLVRFIYDRFDSYAKTIFHERSLKGRGGQNQWIHPDIVAVRYPFDDFPFSTHFVSIFEASKCAIYSFELKVALNSENLKECYFQAVSNSSFANEGYLVVFEDIASKLETELRRLRDSFGIGLIKLEREFSESRVLIPPQRRELDFRTIEMLAEKNTDFQKFIENVTEEMDIGESKRIVRDNYDSILSDEELEEYMRKRGIKQ